MLALVAQRFTASVLAIGVVLMAWATCASGAMPMSEMACCAEHHGECDMAGMSGKEASCCATGQYADVGMLKPERADNTSAPSLHHPLLLVQTSRVCSSSVQAVARAKAVLPFSTAQRSHLAHTVLLI
jgi:hypothetical protein